MLLSESLFIVEPIQSNPFNAKRRKKKESGGMRQMAYQKG